ncbi:hypothetical protein ACIPW5_33135 [Streptomyces sp. NPDC090077]|uniref:hypothetical protein n=1 Tax=Streptomyces sp. NPDC090077 TaxID=3365938 RepID=UPI0037FC764A
MTAWQYFAGAGLVAALCPLHGHVTVAGDGHGRGARVDVCVPGGPSKPPTVRLPVLPPPPVARPGTPSAGPPVRLTVPGAVRPTVRHPGTAPGLAERPAPGAAAPGGPAQPPGAPPAAAAEPEPAAAGAPAPPGPAAAVERVSRFHVRPYHSAALARRGPDGLSTMMLMVVMTTPAVLAAAALRPRSKSRS